MSHIGNYLKGKLGGSKAPKPPRRDYDGDRSNSDDSENDESYLDPTTVHPTSPAHGPIMPSYPPPRPNHSPATRRVQDPGKRASVPVTFDSQNRAPVPRARSQRPQSAEHLQLGKVPVPSQRLKMPRDDYSDPWDAKKTAVSPGGDYTDPWDAKPAQPRTADDYCEPWDKKPSESTGKSSKDDYCDPWDAKKDASPPAEVVQAAKVEDKQPSNEDSDEESYDEPYDLGKVTPLDEQFKTCSIRGMRVTSHSPSGQDDKRVWMGSDKNKQSPSKDQRPPDDYDSPWESKSLFGMKQPSPTVPKDKLQASVHDDRPAEDYDKPWEWNKKSPLNGHTQMPKQHDPLQSPNADARPAEDYDAPWEWSKSGQMVQSREGEGRGGAAAAPKKPPRTYAVEKSAIDPKLPLEQQGWYHGPLKRFEAEKLLQTAEDCSFLLRNSESSKNDYSLSVRNNNSFMHLKIVCEGNKYILGQFSKPFDTVPEMIHYYSINKLNIKGAIHKKLLHPVMQTPEYFTLEPTGYSTAM